MTTPSQADGSLNPKCLSAVRSLRRPRGFAYCSIALRNAADTPFAKTIVGIERCESLMLFRS